MTTLDLPEPELLSVRLDPEQRETLGTAVVVNPEADRVSLGRPVCQPVAPDTVDADTKPFLTGRPDSVFSLLGLVVGFAYDEDNPLESAWVDVALRGQAPADAPEPVAWSMLPLSEANPVNVAKKATFDASLKFKGQPLPVDIGPSIGHENDWSYTQRAVSVEAFGEGTSAARWTFFATEISPIRGTHRLLLFVETASGSSGQAEISVGATIRLRRKKLFRFRAALDKVPEVAVIAIPAMPPVSPAAPVS
jgi:hypothetical protein